MWHNDQHFINVSIVDLHLHQSVNYCGYRYNICTDFHITGCIGIDYWKTSIERVQLNRRNNKFTYLEDTGIWGQGSDNKALGGLRFCKRGSQLYWEDIFVMDGGSQILFANIISTDKTGDYTMVLFHNYFPPSGEQPEQHILAYNFKNNQLPVV